MIKIIVRKKKPTRKIILIKGIFFLTALALLLFLFSDYTHLLPNFPDIIAILLMYYAISGSTVGAFFFFIDLYNYFTRSIEYES